jgi:hypothetical protein
MPTVSEMVYNSNLGPEYNDYYWNGFTTQQRNSNFIYMIPGRPPQDAILIPVSPEWSLFRSVVMESADAIFNLSDTGIMEGVDQAKANRSHFMKALTRVAEIALPPPVAAAATMLGADVRLGINETFEANEEDGVGFIRNIKSGGRAFDRSEVTGEHLDETVANMLQDIFGAAGAAYVKIHEAVATGLTAKGGSITEGLDRGIEALGDSIKRQARYGQPLWGQSVHPSASEDEITKHYIHAKNSMKALANQVDRDYFRAGKLFVDGQLVSGDTIVPSDDPINAEAAVLSKQVSSSLNKLDQEINQLHTNIKTINNARNLGDIRQRNKLRDEKILQMQALRAKGLAAVHDAEAIISKQLSKKYRRDIEFRFSAFQPRANLPTSSIFQELQKPRQSFQ